MISPSQLTGLGKGRSLPNRDGELTMFLGLLQHASSNVTEAMREHLEQAGPTDCRMTAAFDITDNPRGAHHAMPLYDPQDPWWEADPQASLGDAIGAGIERIYREHG